MSSSLMFQYIPSESRRTAISTEVLTQLITEIGQQDIPLSDCVNGLSLCTRVTTDTIADIAGFSKSHVTSQLNGHRAMKPQLKDAITEVFGIDVIDIYEQSRRSE